MKNYLGILTCLITLCLAQYSTAQVGKYIAQKNLSIGQGFGSNGIPLLFGGYYQIKRNASINLDGGFQRAKIKKVKENRTFIEASLNMNVYRFSPNLYLTIGGGFNLSQDKIQNQEFTTENKKTRIGTHLNGMMEYFVNKKILLKAGVAQKYFFDNELRYRIYYGVGYCF